MYTGKFFNERTKAIGFIMVLIVLAFSIIYELRYFSSSALGAFTLYILLRKPFRRLLSKGWNKTLAATVLVISTFLIIVVIGGGVTGVTYSKIKDFNPQTILENIKLVHDSMIQKLDYNIFPEDIVEKGALWLGKALPGLLSATGNVVANVLLMIIILFFMLQESLKFEQSIINFLPLSNESVRLLKTEAHNVIMSNAIGIPVIMLLQAAFSALAYWLTGAGDPIIWGILTGFAGLIPVIGSVVIWLPLSLNLLIGGNIAHGVILMIIGICVISIIENIIRMFFLKKYADVHPLIPLFGVILGINLLGFWGIIFGPLVISGFLLLVKIFNNEFIKN